MRGTAAETDQHTGCTRTHQVSRGAVSRAAADDHWHIEFVNELLEIQRLTFGRDVLGAYGRALHI